MKHVVLAALLAFPFAAVAQPAPKSIADCEKIKGDLAYNQCLASFGPKMGERPSRGAAAAEPADDEPVVARGQRGRSGYARRGGRQRAVFEVGRGRQALRVSPNWRGTGSSRRRQ
ncbi:MAG TPA: hypothetical protein VF601_05050 [Beijerinckiaceae bacterium]|jgi:hypothetical protein